MPLVRRVVGALEPLASETIVSVSNRAMREAIRRLLPDVRFAVDRRPGRGPIEGLASGFRKAHGTRVLVAPCDAPLIRGDLYRLLLESLGRHEAAVPKFDVVDPVRAVYGHAAVLRVLASAKDSLPSPSSLVDRLDAVFLGPDQLRTADPELESFIDVNREEDLARVLEKLTSGRRSVRPV